MALPRNYVEIGRDYITVDGVALLVADEGIQVKRPRGGGPVEMTIRLLPERVEFINQNLSGTDSAERIAVATESIERTKRYNPF